MTNMGRGVSQDFLRGHMWLNIAAAQGSATAGEGAAIFSPNQISGRTVLVGHLKGRQTNMLG
jgi:TPR repeat protein